MRGDQIVNMHDAYMCEGWCLSKTCNSVTARRGQGERGIGWCNDAHAHTESCVGDTLGTEVIKKGGWLESGAGWG